MPDRDPALEAASRCLDARNAALAAKGLPVSVVIAGDTYFFDGAMAGYHAAFRSLGAGTPEAQAALRALVKAVRGWDGVLDAARNLSAVLTVDTLATPTEEGR